MFAIDVKTLFLICSCGCLVVVCAFIVFKRTYHGTKTSIALYSAAELLLATAFFLYANRAIFSGRFFVVLANACLMLGLAYSAYALAFAVEGASARKFFLTNVLTLVLILFFLLVLPHGPNAWVIAMSMLLCCEYLLAGLYMTLKRSMNSMQRYAGLLLLFLALLMAARGVNALLRWNDINLLSTDVVQLLSYLSVFLVTYLLPFLYLLILRERDGERVAASEERYRSLFIHADSGIMICELLDGDYIVLAVNPAFARLFKLKESEAVGRRMTELFPKAKQAPHFAAFEKLARTGEAINFESYSETVEKHFDISAYKVDERRFVALVRDITDRKTAEKNLQKALKEKQGLFLELQHRAKNSLAMIYGLIHLTALNSSSQEVRSVLEHVLSRVRAISELYSLLYGSERTEEVRLDEYCERIALALAGMSDKIKLKLELERLTYPIKDASALGLILTELVTNSAKYAFPERRSGTVRVELKKLDSEGLLVVADDGVGFSEPAGAPRKGGLGLSLVRSLVEQLDGSFTIEAGNGTRCLVRFALFGRPSDFRSEDGVKD